MEKCSKKALKEQYKNRTIRGGVYCIRCSGNHARWLRATTDLQGAKNRFTFSQNTNSCFEPCMAEAQKLYGASAFSLEILEEIQRKEDQTEREFSGDVDVLLELWTEKYKEIYVETKD
ncbi:MAG: GIY-YIG nuclease family protein [Lawsonibacter sp.]